MRMIGINQRDFELFCNPNRSRKLHPLERPEFLLGMRAQYRLYPEQLLLEDFTISAIPIFCHLLITNPAHDGIWLINTPNCEVDIPGGLMSEMELSYLKDHQPTSAIYHCLVRTVLEQNGMDRTILPDLSCNEELMYTLQMLQVGNPLSTPRLYYSYGATGSFNKYQLHIYLVVEVRKPEGVTIPLMEYTCRNLIWYSRETHHINRNTKSSRDSLFGKEGVDIRTTEHGIHLLDTILGYENLFGKSNIY